MRRSIGGRLAVAACLLLGLVGCGDDDGSGDDVRTRPASEVEQEVQRYAERVVSIIGDTELTSPVIDSRPCDGQGGETREDVRSVYGIYQIPLPVTEHQAALERIRRAWGADGWRIAEDRAVGDQGEGVLAGAAPEGGLTASLTSTVPPRALKLSVYSGCFRDADHT